MTTTRNKIRKGLGIEPTRVILAKVVEVNGTTCDASPLNGDADILDARLSADPDTDVLYTPAVDSIVGLSSLSDSDWVVVLFSQLDGVQWGDGDFGGLIKIDNLIDEINDLKSVVNQLINQVQNHTHVSSVPIDPVFTVSPIGNTFKVDIENPDITHGDL